MSRELPNIIGDLVGCVKRTTATRGLLVTGMSPGATAGLPSSAQFIGRSNTGVLRTPYRAPGFTLVELLVTLVIIMMLTAVAVPVLAPALVGRRQREASREVTSYFTLARDTAMRTGRATGVMVERFTGAGNASASAMIKAGLPGATPIPEMSVTLWQVEVPPPYSGDTLLSRATVIGGFGRGAITFLGTSGISEGLDLVRLGDYIKFNTQGHQYQIVGLVDGSGADLALPTSFYLPLPAPNAFWKIVPVGGTTALVPSFGGVPYQIMRQPVRTSTPPLQLPEGIVIDLASSGVTPPWTGPPQPWAGTTADTSSLTLSFCPLDTSNAPVFQSDVIPIVVLFSPTGSVERIAVSGPNPSLPGQTLPYALPPTAPIYFLLGLREKVPAAGSANNENWRDPTSLWITIYPRTGLVTSTENAPLNPPSGQPFATGSFAGDLTAARRLAIEGQTLGGR